MSTPAGEGTRPRRPVGVVLIAAFLVIDAALAIGARVFDIGTGTRQDVFAGPEGQTSIVVMVLVGLRVVAAVGLWLGWRRGWVLTMLLVGISLAIDLWLYWNGQAQYIRMTIDVVLALYLNQGAVRDWFEPSSKRSAAPATGAPPAEP